MELSGFPAIATLPVQWGDQDLFEHVNNTVYFRWIETSRVEYWHKSGLHELMEPLGLGPILASVKCDYKKQLRYPDEVQIGTCVQKMGNSSVTLALSLSPPVGSIDIVGANPSAVKSLFEFPLPTLNSKSSALNANASPSRPMSTLSEVIPLT